MSVTGVVAALAAEARTLGPRRRRSDGLWAIGDDILVVVSGVGMEAAAAGAGALVDAGVTALMSWGMAGGLDPALPAGTICLPTSVLVRDGTVFATDLHWRETVSAAIAAGRGLAHGTMLTSVAALDQVAGKAAAFRETGAVAVDMESAAVARVAAAHHLPFIAVRVIVDTAGDAVPAAVVAASGHGQVNLARLIFGLVLAPGQIASLVRLARHYGVARSALAAVARTGALAPLGAGTASRSRIA